MPVLVAQVRGYRRIFAHTASIFFIRGIAKPETREISSLSCEECAGQEIVVALFEIDSTPETRQVDERMLIVSYLTTEECHCVCLTKRILRASTRTCMSIDWFMAFDPKLSEA